MFKVIRESIQTLHACASIERTFFMFTKPDYVYTIKYRPFGNNSSLHALMLRQPRGTKERRVYRDAVPLKCFEESKSVGTQLMKSAKRLNGYALGLSVQNMTVSVVCDYISVCMNCHD